MNATEIMLDHAGVGPGSRVLDVAARAALAAARRTGPDGLVLAIGGSHDDVRRLRAEAAAEGAPNVYAVVTDRLEPAAFDAVVGRIGLVPLNDAAAAVRPGGRLSMIAGGDARALRSALSDAGFVDVEILPFDGLLVAGGRRP